MGKTAGFSRRPQASRTSAALWTLLWSAGAAAGGALVGAVVLGLLALVWESSPGNGLSVFICAVLGIPIGGLWGFLLGLTLGVLHATVFADLRRRRGWWLAIALGLLTWLLLLGSSFILLLRFLGGLTWNLRP